jgi:hypothetical protein
MKESEKQKLLELVRSNICKNEEYAFKLKERIRDVYVYCDPEIAESYDDFVYMNRMRNDLRNTKEKIKSFAALSRILKKALKTSN